MDLSNVKIGDEFLIGRTYGWSRSIEYYVKAKCEKVTKAQCVIGGLRFNKSNASAIGHDLPVVPYNEDLWQKSQKFLRHRFVENFKYNTLSDEAKEAIYKILKAQEK